MIFVAGHKGMVGSALVRTLARDSSDLEILTADREELNLLDEQAVLRYFAAHSIDEVYLAAARVGGIHANSIYPVEFLLENLAIQNNVIGAAHASGVPKLLFFGSSCIYPKYAKQPISEDQLLTGPLEPTNESYALAKITGIKLCQSYSREYGRDYRSVMPTNLYGPNDNFHPENSHLVPALIGRFHAAKLNSSKEVSVWGSGTPQRELLHVDDLSAACVHLMNVERPEFESIVGDQNSHVNIGTGTDHTIREIADLIARVVGYEGSLVFDNSRPDGTPRKLLDSSRMKELGWESSIKLEEGIRTTYEWYTLNEESVRA